MNPTQPVPVQPPVAPQQTQPTGVDPGHVLGIAGLVLAFISPLIGLIISIIAKKKSKAAGYDNTLAQLGIIFGAILTAIGLIIGAVVIIALGGAFKKCEELGPGTHQVGGVTYTCGGNTSTE